MPILTIQNAQNAQNGKAFLNIALNLVRGIEITS